MNKKILFSALVMVLLAVNMAFGDDIDDAIEAANKAIEAADKEVAEANTVLVDLKQPAAGEAGFLSSPVALGGGFGIAGILILFLVLKVFARRKMGYEDIVEKDMKKKLKDIRKELDIKEQKEMLIKGRMLTHGRIWQAVAAPMRVVAPVNAGTKGYSGLGLVSLVAVLKKRTEAIWKINEHLEKYHHPPLKNLAKLRESVMRDSKEAADTYKIAKKKVAASVQRDLLARYALKAPKQYWDIVRPILDGEDILDPLKHFIETERLERLNELNKKLLEVCNNEIEVNKRDIIAAEHILDEEFFKDFMKGDNVKFNDKEGEITLVQYNNSVRGHEIITIKVGENRANHDRSELMKNLTSVKRKDKTWTKEDIEQESNLGFLHDKLKNKEVGKRAATYVAHQKEIKEEFEAIEKLKEALIEQDAAIKEINRVLNMIQQKDAIEGKLENIGNILGNLEEQAEIIRKSFDEKEVVFYNKYRQIVGNVFRKISGGQFRRQVAEAVLRGKETVSA